MEFVVTLRGTVMVERDGELVQAPADLVEACLDDVMDELMALQARDATIDLDSTDGNEIRFSVVTDAQNPVDAVELASVKIRTAIHAAGGATPDWPASQSGSWGVRLIGVESREVQLAAL